MNKIIGFIGAGNMGQAIIGGIVNSKLVNPQNIIVADINEDSLVNLKEKYSVKVTTDNIEVVKTADIIILAIKPNLFNLVISEIKDRIRENMVIVSIAAGKTIKNIEEEFNRDIRLIRVMPNTPALVREGMSAICVNKNVSDNDLNNVVEIFESLGEAEVIDEKLMDSVIAVSGSSPAYIYILIEAMADAAVMEGMPRKQAYKFAAQTVLGSAKMVLDTNIHPGELKDMVCSPGGTTIEAVAVLENKGFRSSVIEAMRVCAKKSRNM